MKNLSIIFALAFSMLSTFLSAQDRVVTGKVVSSNDSVPLPGVNVVIPRTQEGTITGVDGSFTFQVPAGTDTLEFSFIGMEIQRVALGSRNEVYILMREAAYEVNEVVVTALGISRQTKALGYAVSAVDQKDIEKAGGKSAFNALQGKVAGVNISSASGAPGSSTRILMRGVSSLSGSNQPLFIIDGVPVSNSSSGSSSINGGTDFGNKLNDLNPDDIASVSFLKGASGSALYGSRAANGVVIITTKSGHLESPTQITFTSSVSFEKPLRLIEYQNEFGQGIYGNSILYENMSWGPAFDNKYRPWGHEVDGSIRVKAYSALPENVEEFFETGWNNSNSLAISGGTNATTYYLSYANTFWDGIFPTNADSYKRHALALRGSHKINQKFTSSAALNYIHKENSSVPTGQGEQSVYNQVMQTPRDVSLIEQQDVDSVWNTIDNHYSLYTVNPYQILYRNGNKNIENRFFGNVELNYQATESLAAKARIGGDFSTQYRKSWRERVQPEGNNEYSSIYDPGVNTEAHIDQTQFNSDILLSYQKELGKFNLGAIAGHNLNQRESTSLSTGVNSQLIDGFHHLSNSSERPTSAHSLVRLRSMGVYGNIDLSYKNWLFISATGRNEWSSTLPPANNSYFFPGANLGVVITDMLGLKSATFSFVKIRGSWARVGNDAPPYAVNQVYGQAAHSDGFGYLAYPLAGNINSFMVSDYIGNDELRPEMSEEIEIGTDIRLFRNRIGIDAAYYERTTTDLIWPSPVPTSTGYRYQIQNLGELSNKGVEILVNVHLIDRKDFDWEVSVNFTKNNNKLEYLNNQLDKAELNALRVDGGQQITWVAIPGEPVGVFLARGPQYTDNGSIVVDNQGLPVAADDVVQYGNSQYRYFGGVTSGWSYKGLSFEVLFDYRIGGLMYSRTKDISVWAGTVPLTTYNDREPFIIPNSVVETGRDANGNPVYIENTTPIDDQTLGEFWANGGFDLDGTSLIDKSFVKLRQVAINYQLPARLIEKLPIEQLSLGVIGTNLWLWTPSDQTYIDPEITTFGNDFSADFGEYGAQPTVKSISVNLRVNF